MESECDFSNDGGEYLLAAVPPEQYSQKEQADLRCIKERSFECALCNTIYAQEFTLAMHMRIAHRGMQPPPLQCISPSPLEHCSRVKELMHRRDSWMPKFRSVNECSCPNGYVNAVWGSDAAHFIACGEGAVVKIYDLGTMELKHSFKCNAVVNAIHGSDDGRTLVCGLKSGEVVIRDMINADIPLQTVPKSSGKVFALWLSPDGSVLVVSSDKLIETWIKTANSDSTYTESALWRKDKAWEQESEKCGSLGQHSVCGGTAAFSWGDTLRPGATLLALAGTSVTLWTLDGEILAQIPGDTVYRSVWLSPDCKLLVAGGCGQKIMVWRLPDLELIFVFSAPTHTLALWGTNSMLASAGSDSYITVRSLETGAILLSYPRRGPVCSLWGTRDGGLLVSGGRGSSQMQKLGQSKVVCNFKEALVGCPKDSWIQAMWTDGKLLAWAGSTGITAVGVESGKVLAQLPLKGHFKGTPRCMWGFRLPVTALGWGGRGGERPPEIEGGSGDECCYLLAVGVDACVVLLSVDTSDVVHRWHTPGHVLTLSGASSHQPPPPSAGSNHASTRCARHGVPPSLRLYAGGKWDRILIYDFPLHHSECSQVTKRFDFPKNWCACALAALSPRPVDLSALAADADASQAQTLTAEAACAPRDEPRAFRRVERVRSDAPPREREAAHALPVEAGEVRSAWVSADGSTLAYGDASVCRVQDLRDYSELHAFECGALVVSIWGTPDSAVLATGLSNSFVIIWCLSFAAELVRVDCGAMGLAGISGYGSLDRNDLCIVTGTTRPGQKEARQSEFGICVWQIACETDCLHHAPAPRDDGLFIETSAKGTHTQGSRRRPTSALFSQHLGLTAKEVDEFQRCPSAPDATSPSKFANMPRGMRSETLTRLATLEARHKVGKVRTKLMHLFPTRNGVSSVWADPSGSLLAFATASGDASVSIYRLDALKLCGPTLKILKRSRNLAQDFALYMPILGNLLLDGSLVEWLIVHGKHAELQQLLSVRPSAALLTLACGKSALEIATRMRASKLLELLLSAAVSFAKHGEPHFTAVPSQVSPSSAGDGVRRPSLLPPGMRCVTDCIRLALQSADMAVVISRFLDQLPMFELKIPQKVLPRRKTHIYQGSSSSSGRLARENDLLIWSSEHFEACGFPSSAEVVMLPGLSNCTILELLADQTSDLLYTEPIRCLIDAMRQNGIERIFYTQCLCFLLLIFVYTVFALGTVAVPPRMPQLKPDTLAMFSVERASEYPALWGGAACGLLSCFLSIYFLWREFRELFGKSLSGEDESKAELDEVLTQKLGVAPSNGQAPFNLAVDEPKIQTMPEIRAINQSPSRTSNGRHISVGRLKMHRSSLGSFATQRSEFTAPLASQRNSLIDCTSILETGQRERQSSTGISWKSVSSMLIWKRKFKAKVSDDPTESSRQTFPTTRFPSFLERTWTNHSLLGIRTDTILSPRTGASDKNHYIQFELARECTKKTLKRMWVLLAWLLNIDMSYFLHMWNWLGLVSYALILASFARFVWTWICCGRISADFAAELAAGDGGGGVDAGGVGRGAHNDAFATCSEELVKLRVLTATAIPVLYLYSLYYLRSVDIFAFYVRMLKEVIKDFSPFLMIFIWFLLSVTAGFWSLKCSSSQDSQEGSLYAFALLLHIISLIPFNTQAPPELEECFSDQHVTNNIAFMLLWYLIFILPLLSFNCLIAIMGNTFAKVSRKHKQQQYKEWAQIIGDVIRQWPAKKRSDWEKQFYWIHTLRPQVDTRSPPQGRLTETQINDLQMHRSSDDMSAPLEGATGAVSGYRDFSPGGFSRSSPLIAKQQQDANQWQKNWEKLGKLDLTLKGITQMLGDVLDFDPRVTPRNRRRPLSTSSSDSSLVRVKPQLDLYQSRAPSEFKSWSFGQVSALLCRCRLMESASAVEDNRIDGKTFLKLFNHKDAILGRSIGEGGLGLTILQLQRVGTEIELSDFEALN